MLQPCFQYEGGYKEKGRGLSSHDFETAGDIDKERQITLKLNNGTRGSIDYRDSIPDGAIPYIYDDIYYPSHQATDFYHHWKEDIALFAEMGFKVYRFLFHGVEFFQMVMKKKKQMKMV